MSHRNNLYRIHIKVGEAYASQKQKKVYNFCPFDIETEYTYQVGEAFVSCKRKVRNLRILKSFNSRYKCRRGSCLIETT